MTDYSARHKSQIRKWRKLAKERENERDMLMVMIDHLEIQITNLFPDAFNIDDGDPCYGEVIDTAVELLAKYERSMRDVQAKSDRTTKKGG